MLLFPNLLLRFKMKLARMQLLRQGMHKFKYLFDLFGSIKPHCVYLTTCFRLPVAPDMEIYCLSGVGLPTERSYIYKMSPSDKCKSIPFRIDSSADGETGSCLKSGAYFVDGDDTVPVLSAGFMCAKGWKGRTRFNPSGIATYIREYRHKPRVSLLEGRGTESGAHVDIMGNVALIEDILRVAAGATGAQIGGDRIYSDIMRMSERINLQL